MKDCRITVRLPVELRRRLKEAARDTQTRESDVIRGALERELSGQEPTTAFDRAKKAGLIGIVRNAARDLSTNPKHLRGFGRS